MNRRWLLFRTVAAIILVLSLSFVLIHSHQDGPGQDCGLCYAQHMPGIHSTTTILPASVTLYEWRAASEAPSWESSAFFASHPGRAPPRSLSAIFV